MQFDDIFEAVANGLPFERTIKGSPLDFARTAEDFGLQLQAYQRDPLFDGRAIARDIAPRLWACITADVDASDPLSTVRVEIASGNFHTDIDALPLPDNKTLLRVSLGTGYGARESWDDLWVELGRRGYVPDEAAGDRKPKRKDRWDDTNTKLKCLRELRRGAKRSSQLTRDGLSFTKACQQVGIDPDTVRTHDPELREHWYDPKWG